MFAWSCGMMIPTLGHNVHKWDLLWADWIAGEPGRLDTRKH